MIDILESWLDVAKNQQEIIPKLAEHFDCSPNTIKKRVKEIADKKYPLKNAQGEDCHLLITSSSGKTTTYELVPFDIYDPKNYDL